MSKDENKYQIRFLKDNTYQLINNYNGDVLEEGDYANLLAYIQLEEMGLV